VFPGLGERFVRRLGAARRPLGAALLTAVSCGALFGCGKSPATEETAAQRSAEPAEVVLTPEAAREGRASLRDRRGPRRSHAQVVELRGAGAEAAPQIDPTDDAPSPGAPTDAEVRAELRDARKALASFKKHLNTTAFLATGPRARVLPDGTAVAPDDAPDVVKRVILAANEIAKFPYKWGGGHGAWRDNGYDCSGSVSFALAGAGLLDTPLTSGLFAEWGAPGPGQWITIYANSGHVFMIVAGLRFDTSGQGRAGTRWQDAERPTSGFAVRHPPGL
jgi:cell wall-associated NlpC family hydrolase